jgi:hypothetical protein
VRHSHQTTAVVRGLDRRAHDRRDDHSYPPVANMRFPWYRDARRITELTATDNIIALIARS